MARLELIKELEIRKEEIYSEIRNKLPELIDELESIDKLLGNKLVNITASIRSGSSLSATLITKKQGVGTPRGDMNWIEYVLFMLNEIGGSGKSRDVAKAITNANTDITYDRALNASQDKLSRLLGSGRIKATKPLSKKDGYIYEIL